MTDMNKAEKIVKDFIHDFVNENWDKIDFEKVGEGTGDSKEKFLKEIKKEIYSAMWVLYEVCRWGMDKEYLNEVHVDFYNSDECKFSVIKINDTYIKVEIDAKHNYTLTIVEPKFISVPIFE